MKGRNPLNLTGQRFHRWTVLSITNQRLNGSVGWLCRCDCGTERIVNAGNLRAGLSKSCGCTNRTNSADLTGQRFGHWTALSPTDQRGNDRSVRWLCRCDCGAEDVVAVNSLRRGFSKSCGCTKPEIVNPRLIDLSGQRFNSWTVLSLQKGCRRTSWLCRCDCGNERIIPSKNLRNGHSKSCGCTQKMPDLTGLVINHWTFLSRMEAAGAGRWLCRCDCGTERILEARNVTSGQSKSCGCARRSGSALAKCIADLPKLTRLDLEQLLVAAITERDRRPSPLVTPPPAAELCSNA